MLFRKSATLQPILLIQVSLVQDSSAAGAGGHDTTVDYPTYNEVPAGLSFSCSDRLPGYYADPAAQCQVSCLLPQDESSQVSQLFICTSLKIKIFFLVQTTQADPGVKLPLYSMINWALSRGDEILTTHSPVEMWWRTMTHGRGMKGKLANGMGSQYSSHYLGTWCI